MFRAGMFQWAIWYDFQKTFLNGEQIAMFGAVILLSEVIFQIPTGAFADIFGKKSTLIIGNILQALGTLILGFMPSFTSMWIFAILLGIGTAFLSGTHSALMYNMMLEQKRTDLYPKVKAKGALLFQTFGAASIVVGSYMYTVGVFMPYLARAVSSLVGVILALFLYDAHIDKTKFNFKGFITQNIAGFKELFKNSYMIRLSSLYIMICGIAYSSQRFLVNPYMSELGLDEVAKGWTGMAVKVCVGYLGFVLIKSRKVFEHKNFLLLIPISMILILVPTKYFALPIGYLFLMGIAFSSANADLFMSPVINANINTRVRTTALSALTMLSSLATSGLQFLSGPYIERNQVGDFYQILGIFTFFIILPFTINIIRKQKLADLDLALAGDDSTT